MGDRLTTSRLLVLRPIVGVLRIAAAIAVFAAISTQIVDQSLNDAFVPSEYFSYFTIQTSLINVVVLTVAGVLALRTRSDDDLLTSLRLSITGYAAVTGTVYAVLLRGIPQEGFIGVQWPNEVIHVVIPIFIGADWLLAPGRTRLPWRRLWAAIAYPLAWAAFTIVRGLITGWYPYPFLQPDGPAGWGSVIGYIFGIAVFIVSVAAAAIALSRTARR